MAKTLSDEIAATITEEEAAAIISKINEHAMKAGIIVRELRILGHFNGFFYWNPGDCPTIIVESSLPIKRKAYVLAHEMGHFFTFYDFTTEEWAKARIFGGNKNVITSIEQAANGWAVDYILGTVSSIRGIPRQNRHRMKRGNSKTKVSTL